MACTNCGNHGHNIRTCPKLQSTDGDEEAEGRLKDRSASFKAMGRSTSTASTIQAQRETDKVEKLQELRQRLSPAKVETYEDELTTAARSSGTNEAPEMHIGTPGRPVIPPLPGQSSTCAEPGSTDPVIGTAVTMEAMQFLLQQALSEKIDPLKSAIDTVGSDMKSFKQQVDKEFDGMKVRTGKLEDSMISVQSQMHDFGEEINKIKKKEGGGHIADKVLSQKVETLEKLVADMRIKPTACDSATTIIQGLGAASSGTIAVDWVREAMQKLAISAVLDVYHKCGDREFNGMVFVKFESAEARAKGITSFNASRSAFSDEKKFMNPDLPAEERVPRSFLFGFKRLLVAWELRKSSVHIADDEPVLSVEGHPVVRAIIDNGSLKLDWLSERWSQRKDLVDDPKFKELHQNAQDRLAKSKQGKSKGKGRAPDGSTA